MNRTALITAIISLSAALLLITLTVFTNVPKGPFYTLGIVCFLGSIALFIVSAEERGYGIPKNISKLADNNKIYSLLSGTECFYDMFTKQATLTERKMGSLVIVCFDNEMSVPKDGAFFFIEKDEETGNPKFSSLQKEDVKKKKEKA